MSLSYAYFSCNKSELIIIFEKDLESKYFIRKPHRRQLLWNMKELSSYSAPLTETKKLSFLSHNINWKPQTNLHWAQEYV